MSAKGATRGGAKGAEASPP